MKITSEQLKTTNLIFAEHKKLSETVHLLNNKIDNLEFINRSLLDKDSINNIKIQTSIKVIECQEQYIAQLNKKINKKQKIINWGASISTLIIVVLCLL